MNNVIIFKKIQKERRQAKAKALTLCGSGFHKWKVVIDAHFDVRQGRLVTTERCERCHEERTKLK
jgi:hypothetical protein